MNTSQLVIDSELATKALASLRTHSELPRKGKKRIEEEAGDVVHLIIGLKDLPKYRKDQTVYFDLIHPLSKDYSSRQNIFITHGDATRLQETIKDACHINSYLSFEQLKKAVSKKEARSRFLKQYSNIICDFQVLKGVYHVLGLNNTKKRKVIPIKTKNATIGAVRETIRNALRISPCRLNGYSVDVKMARTKFSKSEAIQNYNAIMKQLLELVSVSDILTIALKTETSVSFPIYQNASASEPILTKEPSKIEANQQKAKERRLRRVNATRVKKEFTPKIKPKKPL